MLYRAPPHLRHLTFEQFRATPEGREQTEAMRRFYATPTGELRGQNNPRVTHAVTVGGGRVTPYNQQPPQSQSMPPRPGQSQREPPRPGQSQRGPAGLAQPQQPQPQGTPYNPQQGGNFSAYRPQQPATQARGAAQGLRMEPGMEAAVFGGERQYNPQGAGGNFSAWDPNIANNAQAPRPPAFQASYGQLGGGYSDQPNMPQRDAFISQINNQLGQMQGQSWQQPMGAPQFNFGQMMGQAGQMAQQGFQNPFAMQPSQPVQSPGPQDNAAAIRNLLQGFNIPQNVMDQISGMFGGQQQPAQPVQGAPAAAAGPDMMAGPAPPQGQAQPQPPPAQGTPYNPQHYGSQPASRPPAGDNAGIRSWRGPPARRRSAIATGGVAADFMTDNADAIKYHTLRTSDIDQLGLPSKEAQALKKQVQGKQNYWNKVRSAQEIQFAFGGKGGGMSRAAYDKKMREFGASPAAAGLYKPLKK